MTFKHYISWPRGYKFQHGKTFLSYFYHAISFLLAWYKEELNIIYICYWYSMCSKGPSIPNFRFPNLWSVDYTITQKSYLLIISMHFFLMNFFESCIKLYSQVDIFIVNLFFFIMLWKIKAFYRKQPRVRLKLTEYICMSVIRIMLYRMVVYCRKLSTLL